MAQAVSVLAVVQVLLVPIPTADKCSVSFVRVC